MRIKYYVNIFGTMEPHPGEPQRHHRRGRRTAIQNKEDAQIKQLLYLLQLVFFCFPSFPNALPHQMSAQR